MTAATKLTARPTAYDDTVRALREAALELSTAACNAQDAIAGIDAARDVTLSIQLAELAQRLHADEHDGPMSWCHHALCKKADEVIRDV